MTTETANLVPVTPEWMERHTTAGPIRNINDIYWKRGPNEPNPGWILVGPSAVPDGVTGRPATAQAESWLRKGRTPLIEYSYTNEVSPITGKRETIETGKDRLATEWRWYWLFKNGGAHLFPIDQIVTYKWHIKPPYGLSKDVFPQLAEWEVPDPLWCHACPGSRPPLNTEKEFVTHCMVHHRMTEMQARDLLKFANEPPVGEAGLNIRRKANRIERQNEAAGIAPLDMPSPEQAVRGSHFICNFCGQEAKSLAGQKAHERSCQLRPVPAVSGVQSGQDSVGPEEE